MGILLEDGAWLWALVLALAAGGFAALFVARAVGRHRRERAGVARRVGQPDAGGKEPEEGSLVTLRGTLEGQERVRSFAGEDAVLVSAVALSGKLPALNVAAPDVVLNTSGASYSLSGEVLVLQGTGARHGAMKFSRLDQDAYRSVLEKNPEKLHSRPIRSQALFAGDEVLVRGVLRHDGETPILEASPSEPIVVAGCRAPVASYSWAREALKGSIVGLVAFSLLALLGGKWAISRSHAQVAELKRYPGHVSPGISLATRLAASAPFQREAALKNAASELHLMPYGTARSAAIAQFEQMMGRCDRAVQSLLEVGDVPGAVREGQTCSSPAGTLAYAAALGEAGEFAKAGELILDVCGGAATESACSTADLGVFLLTGQLAGAATLLRSQASALRARRPDGVWSEGELEDAAQRRACSAEMFTALAQAASPLDGCSEHADWHVAQALLATEEHRPALVAKLSELELQGGDEVRCLLEARTGNYACLAELERLNYRKPAWQYFSLRPFSAKRTLLFRTLHDELEALGEELTDEQRRARSTLRAMRWQLEAALRRWPNARRWSDLRLADLRAAAEAESAGAEVAEVEGAEVSGPSNPEALARAARAAMEIRAGDYGAAEMFLAAGGMDAERSNAIGLYLRVHRDKDRDAAEALLALLAEPRDFDLSSHYIGIRGALGDGNPMSIFMDAVPPAEDGAPLAMLFAKGDANDHADTLYGLPKSKLSTYLRASWGPHGVIEFTAFRGNLAQLLGASERAEADLTYARHIVDHLTEEGYGLFLLFGG